MSSFNSDLAAGDDGAERVAKMVQFHLGADYAKVQVVGGKDMPDILMNRLSQPVAFQAEVKTEVGGWNTYGNVFIEFARRNGEIIGPEMYARKPDSVFFISFIPQLGLAICAHPAHITQAMKELEAEGIIYARDVHRDNSHYKGFPIPPEHLVTRLQDNGHFVFMMQERFEVDGSFNPLLTDAWRPEWNHYKNGGKKVPMRKGPVAA